MSIWGKIIGGVAGFAAGGPLGAMLGAAAGHAYDRMRADDVTKGADQNLTRQVAFTIAVIVLSAKMAKADGRVTRAEIDAFKRVFNIPRHEMAAVGRIFDEAREEASGFEPYARQIAEMFHHDRPVLEELLGGLVAIARSDGPFHPAELDFLRKIAAIFGFDASTFERVRASVTGSADDDPYKILGLDRKVGNDDVKRAWRRLVRENHPDSLMAKGMPKEFVELANKKLAAINAAYDRVASERGLK